MTAAVRELVPADLPRVAAIHLAAFPDSALTLLGPESVRRYYQWLLQGPHDAVALGAEGASTLDGFLFGGHFRGAMTGFIQKNVLFLVLQVLRRPALWGRARIVNRARTAVRLLARRPRRAPSDPRASPPVRSFGVLAIGVDSLSRRAGIGRALMAVAEDRARAAGHVRMHLSVDPLNAGAVAFYERLGWIMVSLGRMEKRLT